MSESASKRVVDPMTKGYMQHLKRIQSKRLEQEALLQRDPIEARSIGRGHWASSTDQSENAGKRSFGPVRPLSAPRGTYNPSASATSSGTVFRGRSRSPSVSDGRSRSGSRSHSRGRSNSVGSRDSRMSTFKRDLQISRALAAEEQQRSEYLNSKKKAYLDRLQKPWMPSGKGHAESSSNLVKQAIANVDKYAQQKAWRKAPWPDYVPPEARRSSGSVSGSREPSRPSTPARRDRSFTEHDAPSHVDVHTAGHTNDDRRLDTHELSPPRTRSRANSHDSRTAGGGNRAGPGPSTWETNSRVHGFILGPPPTAPGNPSAVVDDSATTITQLSMGTGAYTQPNKAENKRKTAASNPSLTKMLPVPIRIVNHESEWVNNGAYFTAFAQGEEDEQPDGNHELFEQQLQGKRPIVSSSSAAGKSQRSDSVSKRDTDTVFPAKRLPLAEPLARYGQTGGAVTYGTLNIRRNCSLAEVLAAARQQFDLEDISDVTLVKHQRYSRATVSYSMSMRTLPDPPPIDDDCTLIFYLGGTLAQSENIHDGAAAFLYHQAHPHGPPPLLSSASIHQSGPPSSSSLTATRRAVAAAAMPSPSSSRRTNRQSPSNSPYHPSSPSRNRREGGGTAAMAMDDRLFVETLEEEARAYNAFVNATAATFATSALSSRRPSSSHLHDLIDVASAQAMTTAEQQPQQWQSVRNVHDLQRRHRFSEPTHQHPGNLEAQTSTSFRWSPSAASRGQSNDPRDAQQPQPHQYDDDNNDDPAADDDHSAHGFQDARLASTYDAWDRRPAPPSSSSKTRPTDYPPMPYAFQDPYAPEPPSRGADGQRHSDRSQRNGNHDDYDDDGEDEDEGDERALYSEWAGGGPNNVSALTLPRFPSYVTAYESEPAGAMSVSRGGGGGGGGYTASPSSSAAALRPKISEFDFMAVAKPSAASASSSYSAAAPMASVSSVRMGVQEAPSSSSSGRPARETSSTTASGAAAAAVAAAGPSSSDGGRMTATELDGAPAAAAAAAAANTQRSSDEEKAHDDDEEPPRGYSATTATTAAPAIRAPEALGDDAAVAEEEEEADRARATHTKAKGSWVDPELARLERRYLKSLHLKPSSLCAKSNSAVALAATPMVHVTPTKTRPPPPPLSPSTTRSWANHRLRPTATTTMTSTLHTTTAGEAASTTSGSRSRSTTPTGGRHHRDFQHPPPKETPLSPSMQRSESAHRQRMVALREKQAAHVDPYDKKAKVAAKQQLQLQQQQQATATVTVTATAATAAASSSSVESKTNHASGKVNEHNNNDDDDDDGAMPLSSSGEGRQESRRSPAHREGEQERERDYQGSGYDDDDGDEDNDNDEPADRRHGGRLVEERHGRSHDHDHDNGDDDDDFVTARLNSGDSAFAGYRNRGPGRPTSAAPHPSSPSQQQQQRHQQADDESSVVSVVTMNSHGTATSRSSNVREMFLDFRDMARKTTLH